MASGRGTATGLRAAHVTALTHFYEAFNEGAIETAIGFLHPEFEWKPAFGRALMGDNVYLGHDGFRAYWHDIQDSFEAYRSELRGIEAVDDHVLLAHVDASGTGQLSGVAIAGRFVIRYELPDGLIVRGRTFGGRAEALRPQSPS